MARAQPRLPTPQCGGPEDVTPQQTEGPFFQPRSPQRADLVEPGAARLALLEGTVLDTACRPLAQALVDLWHADDRGEYDNAGFRYRGHVFTDALGRYRFRTIVPAAYARRTRHYHVKVQAPQHRLLTTQLYFPDDAVNRRDQLFRPELLMQTADDPSALLARFDFVLRAI